MAKVVFLGPKIVTRQLFSIRYLNLGILVIRKQLQGAADVAAIGAAHVLCGKNGKIFSYQVVRSCKL